MKAIQSINSALISVSILPPKTKRNPPVTVNFIFPSSSLNPMFVHFIPSSVSTAAKNPKRMEVIIRARHAWMWAETEKEKTNQDLYRNYINLVLKEIKVIRGSEISRCSNEGILSNFVTWLREASKPKCVYLSSQTDLGVELCLHFTSSVNFLVSLVNPEELQQATDPSLLWKSLGVHMVTYRSRKSPTHKCFWIPDTCTAECTGHIWNPGDSQGVQGSGTTEELEKGASFAACKERWERMELKSAVQFKLSVGTGLSVSGSCRTPLGHCPVQSLQLLWAPEGVYCAAILWPLSSWSSHLVSIAQKPGLDY